MTKQNSTKGMLPIFGLFILVVLNLLMMILINWNWSYSIKNYFKIDKQIDTVYHDTVKSKLLLDKAINRDPYIDVKKEVFTPLLHKKFQKFVATSKKQPSFEYEDILPYFIQIDTQLQNFHYLSQKRWENFKKYGSRVGELYYDSEYEDIIKLVDTTRDKIEEHLAKVLHRKNEYYIYSILLFVIINFIGFIILFVYKQKKERYEIRLSQEKERAIITLHSIGDGVIATDKNGFVTLINDVAIELTGYKKEEAIGKRLEDVFCIIDTKTGETVKNPARKVLEIGKIVNLSNHTVLISKDKRRYHISDSAAPISNADGKIIGVILVFHNVSKEYALKQTLQQNRQELFEANEKLIGHKKRLEIIVQKRTQKLENSLEKLNRMQEQIIQTEKMAALGELVAGVAHEINTPIGLSITGITNFIDETQKIYNLYNSEQMSEENFVKYIENSTNIADILCTNLKQTAELVRSFKQISIDQTREERREFNLKRYINSILLSLSGKLKNTNIKVEIDCAEDVNIYSYPGACSQIVTNLIINSLIHGYNKEDKGTIILSFKLFDSAIHFMYKDDGKGISRENLKKIFNPFFTTNREQGGSGLGLSIIYNIITQKLGGTIECKSTLKNGVEFNIIIPYKKERNIDVIQYKK
ncbi:MAG: PAS domain-containing protein [Epsilonproteobacteria bacterium]|nr:PAS domain-containing protein [Campylobacterota bacterium]